MELIAKFQVNIIWSENGNLKLRCVIANVLDLTDFQ